MNDSKMMLDLMEAICEAEKVLGNNRRYHEIKSIAEHITNKLLAPKLKETEQIRQKYLEMARSCPYCMNGYRHFA